jgi:hypothetical protein
MTFWTWFCCCSQDYHLVGGVPEVLEDFHKEYNEDENASVTPWDPATFDEAEDKTKHRSIKVAYKMRVPGWLLKMAGRFMCTNHQSDKESAAGWVLHCYSSPFPMNSMLTATVEC